MLRSTTVKQADEAENSCLGASCCAWQHLIGVKFEGKVDGASVAIRDFAQVIFLKLQFLSAGTGRLMVDRLHG